MLCILNNYEYTYQDKKHLQEEAAEELQEERAEVEIGQFSCHIIGELNEKDLETIKMLNEKMRMNKRHTED